jgi:predicted metal-dependent phosphoesterase TrpH
VFKVDLHTHTFYSYDVFTPLQSVIRACQLRGIDCLAITDHNEIEGAIRLKDIAPFKVIIGEEVYTTEGEIIGLFLTERILPFLSPEETIAEIRRQGGLVYLPHPFEQGYRNSRFGRGRLEGLAEQIDIVEVFNARNLYSECNRLASEFARTHNLPVGAGSDAHSSYEFGNAYVLMDNFDTKEEFLQNLAMGRIQGVQTPFWIRIILNHLVRKGIRKATQSLFVRSMARRLPINSRRKIVRWPRSL